MKSIKDIYKIGKGPSSSHTMGPAKAMGIFVSENPDADSYEVILYGSLADTGRGHGTDVAIESMTNGKSVNIIFDGRNDGLPHENTMDIFESYALLGISKAVYDFGEEILKELEQRFKKIDSFR